MHKPRTKEEETIFDMSICMENVTKQYQVSKGLLKKELKTVEAVSGLNMNIRHGEILGYIGANGAGKSTTIKIMTGILVPTRGTVSVLGMDPHVCRRKVVKEIGTVFGQRSQLIWDLPPVDTFRLNASLYSIPKNEFAVRMKDLVTYMEMDEIISIPVRKLSLGQRMCCEIIASLLHHPKILFLDEPTIGLDVINKEKICKLIKKINTELGTTIILTTHDMGDVENLCSQIVIVDKGKKIFDGTLDEIKNTYGNEDVILLETMSHDLALYSSFERKYNCKIEKIENGVMIRNSKKTVKTMEIVNDISLNSSDVREITIKHMNVEDIVKKIYKEGV